MRLDDVSVEAFRRPHQLTRVPGELDHDIHAKRKIRRPQKRGLCFLRQAGDAGKLVVPAGGPHDYRATGAEACGDVSQRRGRLGELDGDLGVVKRCRRDTFAAGV